MATGIIGRKLGMTRVFTDDGHALPVTIIEAGPCPVLRVVARQRGSVQDPVRDVEALG